MGLFEKLFGKKKNNEVEEVKNEAPQTKVKAEAPASKVKAEEPAPVKEAPATVEVKTEATAEKVEATPAPKKTVKKAPDVPKAEKVEDADKKAEPVVAPTEEKAKVTGKFEIKKAKDGRFVFNLYAPNRVIVATSQVYSSSTAAVNGINSVINNAEKAPIEDHTLKTEPEVLKFPKWEMYIDKGGQYRFKLYAANGSCICHSQGYTAKANCKNGIESIIRCSRNPEIDKSYLKKED